MGIPHFRLPYKSNLSWRVESALTLTEIGHWLSFLARWLPVLDGLPASCVSSPDSDLDVLLVCGLLTSPPKIPYATIGWNATQQQVGTPFLPIHVSYKWIFVFIYGPCKTRFLNGPCIHSDIFKWCHTHTRDFVIPVMLICLARHTKSHTKW